MKLSTLKTFDLRTLRNILALVDYEMKELTKLKSFSEDRYKMLTVERLTVSCAIVQVEDKENESKDLAEMFN